MQHKFFMNQGGLESLVLNKKFFFSRKYLRITNIYYFCGQCLSRESKRRWMKIYLKVSIKIEEIDTIIYPEAVKSDV